MSQEYATANNELALQPQAEFEAGSFAIHYLSHSPEGFELVTDGVLPKQGVEALEVEDREVFKNAFIREMKFNDVDAVRQARQDWREAPKDDRLKQAFFAARSQYQNKGKKVGLRNMYLEDGTIHVDVQPVHFPSYNLYATPGQSPEKEAMSRLAGVAMVVRTADNRLIVQHRAVETQHLRSLKKTRGNAAYTDIPGASVAGMVDATIKNPDRQSGTIDPIDTTDVQAAILKEAGEELGLGSEHLTALRLVGVAEDKIKVHDELLLLADTMMTAEQVRETSRLSSRNKNLGDADFEEKFTDIAATPEAIGTLLSEVHCPLPPTHAATLVAAGYSIALQSRGSEFAANWQQQMEQAVRGNYEYMDGLVADFYKQYPAALHIVPERYWGKNVPTRNLEAYTPAYAPDEQGLPTFADEMVRTGLLPETRQIVPNAYLFDVDGPLSDPNERKVVEPGLFDEIVKRLSAGEPVGLNSGRSVAWMERQVADQVITRITDKTLLERFVIIGEKGGAWLTFGSDGQKTYGRVADISVPDNLRKDVATLVSTKYADCVADLDPKQTMLSLEMLPGYDLTEFSGRKQAIASDIREIITDRNLDKQYSVDPTTIAVDIESPYVGKNVGADRFIQYLDDLGLKAEVLHTFGDSASDADMADELIRRKYDVRFVNVGTDRVSDAHYPVILPGRFSQGTLAYLRQQ